MKSLDEKEWDSFYITQIFEVLRGRENNMATLEKGDMPLISAKNINNGVKDFVSTSRKIISGGCITLNNDGDGGAGLAYYQPADMSLDTHVTALIPKEKLSEYTLKFIAECIAGLHGFFGHGLSISNSRAQKIKIMLPVTDNGKPDYEYMAEYVHQQQISLLNRYRNYVSEKLQELGDLIEIPALDEKEWRAFSIESIFNILSGKRLVAADSITGDRPFIGAIDNNNGVSRFCGDSNASLDRNVLGINYNGSVGNGFYHPYECIFSDDVKRFHLKNYEDNECVLLFMKTVILQQGKKFGYSYKFNAARMNNTKILLPVDDTGEPDYAYMEQYVKNLMIKKYHQYLDYTEKH